MRHKHAHGQPLFVIAHRTASSPSGPCLQRWMIEYWRPEGLRAAVVRDNWTGGIAAELRCSDEHGCCGDCCVRAGRQCCREAVACWSCRYRSSSAVVGGHWSPTACRRRLQWHAGELTSTAQVTRSARKRTACTGRRCIVGCERRCAAAGSRQVDRRPVVVRWDAKWHFGRCSTSRRR